LTAELSAAEAQTGGRWQAWKLSVTVVVAVAVAPLKLSTAVTRTDWDICELVVPLPRQISPVVWPTVRILSKKTIKFAAQLQRHRKGKVIHQEFLFLMNLILKLQVVNAIFQRTENIPE
jgi:hypothetical protein